MKLHARAFQTTSIAVVLLAAGNGFAGTFHPAHNDPAHRSSLHAIVTMADGTTSRVTLEGVGCTQSICSRVRAKDTQAGDVWLDSLVSIRDISHETSGPVSALFTLRDGSERRMSVIAWHRVLYTKDAFGLGHQLDLARVNEIDFE